MRILGEGGGVDGGAEGLYSILGGACIRDFTVCGILQKVYKHEDVILILVKLT